MNEIFLILLSLSLSGSLIALLLFLLKPILKNRLSKTWQYYIFLIVIVRLLLPFGPDTSLMRIVFNQVGNYVAVNNNSAVAPNTDNILLLQEDAPQEKSDGNVVTFISTPSNKILEWLWLVWFIFAILLFLRKMAAYYHYTRSVKRACSSIEHSRILDIYKEVCNIMAVKCPPKLAQNEQIAAPMIAGIIRPVIILPDVDLPDADFRYVFLHELIHYKRLDIAYKWLMQIALCIHWFNPIVYRINCEVNRNCELSCDEAVIWRLDEKSRFAYGDMLLEAINVSKIAPRTTVTVTLSEDTKLMKERLGAIMMYKKKSRKIAVLSALLAALLFCGATFVGVYTLPNSNPASQSPDMQGGIKNDAPNVSDAIQPYSSLVVNEVPVTIEKMEIRYYEDKNPNGRWPYIHWILNNNSDKTISDYEMVCLAYDKDGKPLELIWEQFALTDGDKITGFTSQSDKSYEQVITLSDKPILPGAKEDLNGGWSLWDGWDQAKGTHTVEHVLACMKQITFEDGTVWENPDYEKWLSSHRKREVKTNILESYYL